MDVTIIHITLICEEMVMFKIRESHWQNSNRSKVNRGETTRP